MHFFVKHLQMLIYVLTILSRQNKDDLGVRVGPWPLISNSQTLSDSSELWESRPSDGHGAPVSPYPEKHSDSLLQAWFSFMLTSTSNHVGPSLLRGVESQESVSISESCVHPGWCCPSCSIILLLQGGEWLLLLITLPVHGRGPRCVVGGLCLAFRRSPWLPSCGREKGLQCSGLPGKHSWGCYGYELSLLGAGRDWRVLFLWRWGGGTDLVSVTTCWSLKDSLAAFLGSPLGRIDWSPS